MSQPELDAVHMSRALKLAARGLYTTDPNPRVGCVIAKAGEVVGEGHHQRAGGPHAEVVALAAAGERARGATAYVTLEPCSHHGRTPPCADALVAAGIARVVYALRDPNPRVNGGGEATLSAAGIEVTSGVLEKSARALNVGFLSRMERGRPWVRLKLASSLDGRTALADGESRWITGETARADVQRLRARSSAILTGAGTVTQDDPRLNVRLPGATRQPLRVVLDEALEIPLEARILSPPGEVVVMTASPDAVRAGRLAAAGARVETMARGEGGLDLHAVMARLAELEVNELHVECGSKLAGGLLSAGLIDELVVYLAPTLLGVGARPLMAFGPLANMDERPGFAIVDTRRIGPDLKLTLRPVAAGGT
jgi:diaminohydroxyphosphoribosylaminopyrimidine deaminase/5-amino-6-(5-phosphoribosylamino)uracil reductase